MATKRKSDVFEAVDAPFLGTASSDQAFGIENVAQAPSAKKARVSDVADEPSESASTSKGKKKAKEPAPPKKWQDVVLEGEEEGDVKIYDDCNDVRRKIRALQKEPGFKVTHWLREIGGINGNSLNRFSKPLKLKASGPTAGATNGAYVAAYKYFEKRRIAEGKKKTPKRIRNEEEHRNGLPLERSEMTWCFIGRREPLPYPPISHNKSTPIFLFSVAEIHEMSQESVLHPFSPTDNIHTHNVAELDDGQELWTDAPETLEETDGMRRDIQEVEQRDLEDITLKPQNFTSADLNKATAPPVIDTTLDGPSPITRSPTEHAFDAASVQSLPAVQITEPQSPNPRPQTASATSFNGPSVDETPSLSSRPSRSSTTPSYPRRSRPGSVTDVRILPFSLAHMSIISLRSRSLDHQIAFLVFFSNLIHRREPMLPSSPRRNAQEERATSTPEHSTIPSRASSPTPTTRPSTPPPALPPPTLQELGLSLSVLTTNLSPSHFSTPPASGAFLAPHYLLLCHAQGLDVLPLISPPAPQPYALIRRVSFKSVVVMEHRGVLVAIAGRRDGVRVYALEEVKKAVEWRLEVEIRREQDRARRDEAKRGISRGKASCSTGQQGKKLHSLHHWAEANHCENRRRPPRPATSTAKMPPAKRLKTPPQSPPQPFHPPALNRVPSVPPPSYSISPPSGRPRSQSSIASVSQPPERRSSIGNVLAGSIARRHTDAAMVGRDYDNDPDLKGDWVEGRGSSDDEAINVVAAGASGSEALDERTSAMAAASSGLGVTSPPLTTRPLSSATLTSQPIRRPRPPNLDLSSVARGGSTSPGRPPPPPSPTPTLVTLRQTLSTSPSSGHIPTMSAIASETQEPDEPATPDGDEDGTQEGQATPTNEHITFAQALEESRLPELPPPGSRRSQQVIMITSSHAVATGEEDIPASPQSAEASSFRTRPSQDTQSTNQRRRRWSVLGGIFPPPSGSSLDEQPSVSGSANSLPHPIPTPSASSSTDMRERRPTLLARSHSSTFQHPPTQTQVPEYSRPASSPSNPPRLSRDGQSTTSHSHSHSRFLSRIIGNAFASRRSIDSASTSSQRVEQMDGARKSTTTPTTFHAPAPKLEYVKLPGTKCSLMIKAVETNKKSFLAILCGENGEKVELFAGTYRTALGLSRTFILPDSPRSLELQLQGDDLVEVFLVFSQNVFGLEPATVRVREVRIGRAERRAARRRAREMRTEDAQTTGNEADPTAPAEESTNVNVSIGVSVPSSTPVAAESAPVQGTTIVRSSVTAGNQPAPPETPNPPALSHAEELVALATAQMGPYTTFQQLSFAPNFPLASIADEYVIPPTYPDFLQYRVEHEPEVNGSGDIDLSQVQFSPPGLPLPPPATPSKWFYRDPKGVVHGPWKHTLMQAWYRDGLLPTDLPVRREEDDAYILLKDLRQQSVDPTQPFGPPPFRSLPSETVPLVADAGKPLLNPLSLLAQPKIFGPPALFFSSRGGHSTVIVDGRGRSVLKGRFMWSSDDQDDESSSVLPGRLGDVKRLEAFDVKDRSVLVAMRQGGLEAVDLSDALLRPADASRSVLPQFSALPSQLNRRAPFIWKIGMPVSSPSASATGPTSLLPSKPHSNRLAAPVKKLSTGPGKSPGRADFADTDTERGRDEVIFLGRRGDNIYLCERNGVAFRILRLCPLGAA
ncbi:hypothetical protein EW146_g1277 [Bondarzewia mesenterica]|uniref:GYF domain-containing protein n=1 Tax=Bondarzewia mesenterica TaxID=1095465 RepID=A0A4S4M4E1_9AGAM|nr:hypothetical protein EW146_g1277 [Bondarzewia mesenterica]